MPIADWVTGSQGPRITLSAPHTRGRHRLNCRGVAGRVAPARPSGHRSAQSPTYNRQSLCVSRAPCHNSGGSAPRRRRQRFAVGDRCGDHGGRIITAKRVLPGRQGIIGTHTHTHTCAKFAWKAAVIASPASAASRARPPVMGGVYRGTVRALGRCRRHASSPAAVRNYPPPPPPHEWVGYNLIRKVVRYQVATDNTVCADRFELWVICVRARDGAGVRQSPVYSEQHPATATATTSATGTTHLTTTDGYTLNAGLLHHIHHIHSLRLRLQLTAATIDQNLLRLV